MYTGNYVCHVFEKAKSSPAVLYNVNNAQRTKLKKEIKIWTNFCRAGS